MLWYETMRVEHDLLNVCALDKHTDLRWAQESSTIRTTRTNTIQAVYIPFLAKLYAHIVVPSTWPFRIIPVACMQHKFRSDSCTLAERALGSKQPVTTG